MGLRYRKSVKVGPFRVNVSTSGVGWSVGGTGFRTGRSSTGRNYTRFSLPGTGLSYETTRSRGKGCGLGLLMLAVGLTWRWLS